MIELFEEMKDIFALQHNSQFYHSKDTVLEALQKTSFEYIEKYNFEKPRLPLFEWLQENQYIEEFCRKTYNEIDKIERDKYYSYPF